METFDIPISARANKQSRIFRIIDIAHGIQVLIFWYRGDEALTSISKCESRL